MIEWHSIPGVSYFAEPRATTVPDNGCWTRFDRISIKFMINDMHYCWAKVDSPDRKSQFSPKMSQFSSEWCQEYSNHPMFRLLTLFNSFCIERIFQLDSYSIMFVYLLKDVSSSIVWACVSKHFFENILLFEPLRSQTNQLHFLYVSQLYYMDT